VGPFYVVELKSPRQCFEHLVGDGVLPALLEAAVMIRAQPGQDRQFFFAQTGDASGARERCDPGLRGR
jgi:hypothetical protein